MVVKHTSFSVCVYMAVSNLANKKKNRWPGQACHRVGFVEEGLVGKLFRVNRGFGTGSSSQLIYFWKKEF
jgi:hypothetical protein